MAFDFCAGGLRAAKLFLARASVVAIWLLATVGIGGIAYAGPDACIAGPPGTVTCAGDQSLGIQSGSDFFAPPVSTVIVSGVTANINGISVSTTNDAEPITISLNSGAYSVSTSTDGTDGLYLFTVGDASNLSVTAQGSISTTGDFAYGILARTGGSTSALDVANSASISTSGDNAGGINAYTTGAGSALMVVNSGSILATNGNYGISAFTNGEGSNISFHNSGTINATGFGAEGMQVVSSGIGSSISATNTGNITTSGQFAHGIVVVTNAADSPLQLSNSGNISTSGFADGIIARTVGQNSPLHLASSGDITLAADAVHAILARADLSPISVQVTDGNIRGGTGSAIYLFEGGANTLDIGTTAVLSAYSNSAIGADIGNDTVNNSGLVIGNVNLGSGANAFNNLSSGLFEMGASVNIGAGNVLTNDGALSPGGEGAIHTTEVTGHLVQSAAGSILIDVDPMTGQADLINVSGTASLAGTLRVNPINAGPAPGFQEITILHADGGITDNGITIVNTGAITYSLLFPNPNDLALALGVMVDFAPDGMNRNQTALGNNVNAIQAAGGSSAFQPVVTALSSLPDVPSLAAAYNALSPELYLKTQVAALFSSLSFADNLMSCRVRDGGYAIIREGQCIWAEASGRFLNQDQTRQSVGFDEDAWRFAAGAQFAIAAGTHINVAAGYENGSLTSASARADVDRAMAGIAVKHQTGPLMFSAALTGGYGWHDDKRTLAFDGFSAVARADHDVSFVAGRLRAAWLQQMGGWYVKPMADIDVTYIHASGVRETGGGGAALSLASRSDTIVSFSPALEIGSEIRAGGGLLLRPYARAGMTVFSDTEFAVTSQFLAAPAGVPGFSTLTEVDRVVADVSAGVDLLGTSGMTLRLGYDGRFGDTIREHSIGAKATFPF